jgi:hypothetical protein
MRLWETYFRTWKRFSECLMEERKQSLIRNKMETKEREKVTEKSGDSLYRLKEFGLLEGGI